MRPCLLVWMVLFPAWAKSFAAGEGWILRPADKSVLRSGEVDIVATAPGGRLELDGRPVAADKPFPDVLHAMLKASPGAHRLSLVWDGGSQEVRFFCGSQPPAGYALFHEHPPVPGVDCSLCHELTKRGRFHFKGSEACFTCHQKDTFATVHSHTSEILNECGLCHNAHGSTAKAHLLFPREVACKQCHN